MISARLSGQKGGFDTRPAGIIPPCVGSYVGEQNMNYQRIYDQFIADRRSKQSAVIASGVYTEVHHELPRSLGGDDSPENLVTLTFRDHVHAHILLGKIYGGRQWIPAYMMVSSAVSKKRTPITKPMISAAVHARKMYSKVAGDLIREIARRPDVRAKHSANSKAKWADPEWAARQISKYVAAQGKPEARKRNAEQASKMHQRPGFKELHIEATKAALTPEVCEARGKALSESLMSCPKKRAAKSDAAKLGNGYRSAASKYFGIPYHRVTSEMVAQWKQETLSTGECGYREVRTAIFRGVNSPTYSLTERT